MKERFTAIRRWAHKRLWNMAAKRGWDDIRKWHQRTCPHLEKNTIVWGDLHCAWCGQTFEDVRVNAFFNGTESARIAAGYARISDVGHAKLDWAMRLASEALAWNAEKKKDPRTSSSGLPMLIATIIAAKDEAWPEKEIA